MNKKNIWFKIAIIALYVAVPILFVVAASLYALGDLVVPIILVVLALACLYAGIILNAKRKKIFAVQGTELTEPVEKPKKAFFKRTNVIVAIFARCMFHAYFK